MSDRRKEAALTKAAREIVLGTLVVGAGAMRRRMPRHSIVPGSLGRIGTSNRLGVLIELDGEAHHATVTVELESP